MSPRRPAGRPRCGPGPQAAHGARVAATQRAGVAAGHRHHHPSHGSAHRTGHVKAVTAQEFAALLGQPLPDTDWDRHRTLGGDDIIAQLRHRRGPGRLLVAAIDAAHVVLMRLGKPIEANYTHFLQDLPLRSMARMSGGRVSQPMLDAILQILNGRVLRGVRALVPAALAHRRANQNKNPKKD